MGVGAQKPLTFYQKINLTFHTLIIVSAAIFQEGILRIIKFVRFIQSDMCCKYLEKYYYDDFLYQYSY